MEQFKEKIFELKLIKFIERLWFNYSYLIAVILIAIIWIFGLIYIIIFKKITLETIYNNHLKYITFIISITASIITYLITKYIEQKKYIENEKNRLYKEWLSLNNGMIVFEPSKFSDTDNAYNSYVKHCSFIKIIDFFSVYQDSIKRGVWGSFKCVIDKNVLGWKQTFDEIFKNKQFKDYWNDNNNKYKSKFINLQKIIEKEYIELINEATET